MTRFTVCMPFISRSKYNLPLCTSRIHREENGCGTIHSESPTKSSWPAPRRGRLTPQPGQNRTSGVHWIEGQTDPRIGTDAWERKYLVPSGNRFPAHPARSLVTLPTELSDVVRRFNKRTFGYVWVGVQKMRTKMLENLTSPWNRMRELKWHKIHLLWWWWWSLDPVTLNLFNCGVQ